MTREYIPNPEYDAEYAASTIRPMSGEESLVRIVALERRIAELERLLAEARERPCYCKHGIRGRFCLDYHSKETRQLDAKPSGLTSPIAREVMEEIKCVSPGCDQPGDHTIEYHLAYGLDGAPKQYQSSNVPGQFCRPHSLELLGLTEPKCADCKEIGSILGGGKCAKHATKQAEKENAK